MSSPGTLPELSSTGTSGMLAGLVGDEDVTIYQIGGSVGGGSFGLPSLEESTSVRARVFISHSSADDGYTADVRQLLFGALGVSGFDPYLDVERLNPGVEWRTKLFAWMATCEGAVLLLDANGLESAWVRSEATILAWRAALDRDFRLIPVLIDQPRSALQNAGLNPVAIDRLQLVKSLGRPPEEVVAEVLSALEGLQPRTGLGPMAIWITQVVAQLTNNDMLEVVADRLEIPVPDRMMPGLDARHGVAHRLLHGEIDEIEAALAYLAVGMTEESRIKLGRLLSPSWLPEGAAAALLAVVADPGSRVAELNVANGGTARRLVIRATCADPLVQVVSPPSEAGIGELTAVDLTERYRAELLHVYGASRPDIDVASAVASYHKARPDLFVVIKHEDVGAEVLTALYGEFTRVKFVYADSADPTEPTLLALDEVGARLVDPGIDRDLERHGSPAATRMEGIDR